MGTESGAAAGGVRISSEIEAALRAGSPIVALESALITHGLPYPLNLKVARGLELEIREVGALPATIAALHGEIIVGIGQAEMEALARDPETVKLGMRDLASVAVRGLTGGTTVAATVFIAQSAGIQVFCTGGIGGVHRGSPFDVSADLEALARFPLIVVSAGAKAILDVGGTLERLETLSVPVIGYETQEFPAFYSRESGFKANLRLDTPNAISEYWRTHCMLGLPTAVLIANPIPKGSSLPLSEIEGWVERAAAEAQARGIRGQPLTPFLLQRVGELSGGRTIEANTALLLNNARLAAEIAVGVATRR